MSQLKKIQRRALLKEAQNRPMTLEETGVPEVVKICIENGMNIDQAIVMVLSNLPPMPVEAQENVKTFVRFEYGKHFVSTVPQIIAPDLSKKSGLEIVLWILALSAMVGLTFAIQAWSK